jgi:hypothetical protein
MDAHAVLLIIAIVCELAAVFMAFRPDQPRATAGVALGLVFFFISLLVPR